MCDPLTYSGSTILCSEGPVESELLLRPESMHIKCNDLKVGNSTWMTNFSPIGDKDDYAFSIKEQPGLLSVSLESGQVVRLKGILPEHSALLSISGSKIAQISKAGTLYVYRQSDCTDSYSLLMKQSISNPKAMAFSCDQERLFWCNANGLSILDIASGKELSLCQDLQINRINCNPFDKNLFSFTDHSHLYLCDNRQKGSILEKAGQVLSLNWSPIVSYWMASTSPSSIDIYDLRYGIEKSMRSYSESFTTQFSWSNSNADLFCTCTPDRSLLLWSLASDTKVDTVPLASGSVFPSKLKPNTFHGASILSKMVTITLNQDFLYSIAPVEKSIHEELDRSLYCRDFDSVQTIVTGLLDDKNLTNSTALNDLQQKLSFYESVDFKVNDEVDAQVFESDLKQLQSRLPRNHAVLFAHEGCLQSIIEMIKIKSALNDQNNSDIRDLLSLFESTRISPLPSSLLFEVICRMTANGNKRLAIEKAQQVLSQCGPRLDQNGCRIVHLLLYPTIFDEIHVDNYATSDGQQAEPNRKVALKSPIETVLSSSNTDLYRIIKTTKSAIQMLQFELDILISKSTAAKPEHTISFNFHRILLQSFIEKGLLDDYFLHIIALQKQFPTATSCHRFLNWHRDTHTVPKLGFVFEQAASEKKATLSLRCLLSACKIVHSALQSNHQLSTRLDTCLVTGVRNALKGHRMSECMWFNGYGELKSALEKLNLKDRQLKKIVSSALLKELHLLHSKLL